MKIKPESAKPHMKKQKILRDSLLTLFFLVTATLISFWFFYTIPENSSTIALIYITALVLTARFTNGYAYAIAATLASVIGINYLFTYPYFTVNFTLTGYPVTFIFTLLISLIVSTLTTRFKAQSDALLEREKLLMDAEKEKMRANLLRSVSHDLRTPLTGIIGNSSVYIDNSHALSEDEKLLLVSHIREDANWLLNMVENLLSVTRIRETSMTISTSMESVEEVVSEALQRLKKRFPASGIKVTVPDEFILIPMDAMLIEQVIINLLENAIVHSGSKLPIELNVSYTDELVSFSIKDYGTGIPKDRLDTIFDGACYSPDNSSDSYRGMGIGLSICKTLITAHNGVITASSHAQGCTFTFSLPRENKKHE